MKNLKRLYLAGVVVMSCAFIVLLGRSSFGQPDAAGSSENGRYQMLAYNTSVGSGIIAMDTRTGRS